MTEADTDHRIDSSLEVLWLTRYFPFPPAQGGDVIYTRQLMAATAAAGARIRAFVLDGSGAGRDRPNTHGISWTEGGRGQRPNWASLFSLLPNQAGKFLSAAVEKRLLALLDDKAWDAIVLDNLSAAAYLSTIRRWMAASGKSPKLVYVAHNHEKSTHWSVARDNEHSHFMRAVLSLNAMKVERLERRLVRACRLVSVNTEEDRKMFAADAPEAAYIVLKPAYDGRRIPLRDLSRTGRIVIVLGSYLWIPKRANLEAFLAEATSVFPEKQIQLRVVGAMDAGYRQTLKDRFPWAEIVGPVPEVESELDLARIGVVPEIAGGGFKHKTLFYVFNRVAAAGITDAMAGSLLEPQNDYIAANDLPSLVRGIAEAIDDVPRLSAMVERAYGRCVSAFNWADRGIMLADAIRWARDEKSMAQRLQG